MNDKLDKVRRRVTAKLNIIQQNQLKGLRFSFLKNNENLPEDAKIILRNMRGEFQELGDAYMFKEALRVIYWISDGLTKLAYGFQDSEYFKLKIYQFPEISSVK